MQASLEWLIHMSHKRTYLGVGKVLGEGDSNYWEKGAVTTGRRGQSLRQCRRSNTSGITKIPEKQNRKQILGRSRLTDCKVTPQYPMMTMRSISNIRKMGAKGIFLLRPTDPLGNQTQDTTHAKQVLYLWAASPAHKTDLLATPASSKWSSTVTILTENCFQPKILLSTNHQTGLR